MVIITTNKGKGKQVQIHLKKKHAIQEKLRSAIGNDIRRGECYNKLVSLDKRNANFLIDYCLQYKSPYTSIIPHKRRKPNWYTKKQKPVYNTTE